MDKQEEPKYFFKGSLPEGKDESSLLSQIKVDYNYCFQYFNPKRIQNLDRIRLYSNQTRDKELVGDTTLFTIFNTVHSKLYGDELSSVFAPGHPDDVDKCDSLSPVYKYDCSKMNKPQLDYMWDWNVCFWGAGWLDVSTWDSKKKLMCPSVIDNATFLIDPDCTTINGDMRGFGKARFWGREIAKTKFEMKADGNYSNFENLTGMMDYQSLDYQKKQFERTAKNLAQAAQPNASPSEYIPLLEWWTVVGNEMWMFSTDTQFQKIVRSLKWEDKDKMWPLVQRNLFPMPGDVFGVSIPDLIEDKQRARNILLNLGLMDAKAQLYPMYVYDRNAISVSTDLSFNFNKWIPTDGKPTESVMPLPKNQVGEWVSYIMDVIDTAAQKATGATTLQQGAQNEKPRSANEVVRQDNNADDRITTGMKVFGWSERDFTNWWLKMYNKYFSSLQEKMIRIDGAFGPKFHKITGDQFQFEEDPDIYIESKVLNDAKNQNASQRFVAYTNIIAQDQSVNRRYWNKMGAKIVAGLDSEQVVRLYPETADEMKAKMENDRLSDNKLVTISINDDHHTHLIIHAQANATKASVTHIAAHQHAIMIQRQIQQLQGQGQPQPGSQPTGNQTQPNMAGVGSAPAAAPPQAFSVKQ